MKVTILSHRNVPSPDLARAGQLDTLVIYSNDAGESDAVIVQGANPTNDAIDQAIRAQVLAAGKSVGRSIEV